MAELEAEIAQLLREYQAKTGKLLTIGTVESATGGSIADRITNVPGSSDYFKGSVVAYSNEVKIALLGVKKATIENYGAVSEQTALEMARGGRKLLHVDICVSDTGIAGPSGATPEKPVGLFYLGLAAKDASLSQKHAFPGNREGNKRDAAEAALNMLKQWLKTKVFEDKGVKIKSERRLRTMTSEKFTVDGSQVVEKIKELIHQGNIRRVRLIHKGRPLIDIPLTAGVGVAAVTALAAPVLAALGAIAALVTECTIEVERVEDTPAEKDKKQ